MGVNKKVNINVGKILKSRGLGTSTAARHYLASEVVRLSDPYVPMQSGALKRSAKIANDGSSVTYTAPYAHYQWEGVVYGPNYTDGVNFWSGKAPKKPTGEQLTYHNDSGLRGKYWTKRMVIDRKEDLERTMDAYVKHKKS